MFGRPPIGRPELNKVKLTYSAEDSQGNFSLHRARIILKEAYDIEYGLYDHDDPNLQHPLQYHLMSEQNKVAKFGLYRQYLRQYYHFRVKEFFDLSFEEFINTPMDRVDDILAVAAELMEKKSEVQNNQLNQLRSEMKQVERQSIQYGPEIPPGYTGNV